MPSRETSRLPKSQTSRVPEKSPASGGPGRRERDVEVVVAPALQEAVGTPEVRESVSHILPKSPPGGGKGKTSGVPESGSSEEGPLYLRLTRKEVRFRDDQLEALDRLARRLVRTRRGGGERITENTLVRVAVDFFLERAEGLAGRTEAELLEFLRAK